MEPLSLVNTALSLFSGRSETVEAVAPPAGLFSSLMTSAEGPVSTPPPAGTTADSGEGFSDWSGLMARTEGLEAAAPIPAPVATADPASTDLRESLGPAAVALEPSACPEKPSTASLAVATAAPTVLPSASPSAEQPEPEPELTPTVAPLTPPLRKDGKGLVAVDRQGEPEVVEEEADGLSEEVEKISPGEKKRPPSAARARTDRTEGAAATHGPPTAMALEAAPIVLGLPLPTLTLAGEGGGESEAVISAAGDSRAEAIAPSADAENLGPSAPVAPLSSGGSVSDTTEAVSATLASFVLGDTGDSPLPEDVATMVATANAPTVATASSRPKGPTLPEVSASSGAGSQEGVAMLESSSSRTASASPTTAVSTSAGALAATTPTLTAVSVTSAPSNPLPRKENEVEGRVGARTGKPLVRSLVEIGGQNAGPSVGGRAALQAPLPAAPLASRGTGPALEFATVLDAIDPAGGPDLPEAESEAARLEAPSLSAAPSEGIAPEGPRAAPERLTAAHFPHRLEELRSELLEQGKERHLVSLELEPEHLGKVRVSLSCEPASEKVRALLSVTSGETARVLDKALSSAGTDGLAISIEIGSGTSEGRGWADSPTRPPLPPRRTESPLEATLASLVEPTPRVAPRGLYA